MVMQDRSRKVHVMSASGGADVAYTDGLCSASAGFVFIENGTEAKDVFVK